MRALTPHRRPRRRCSFDRFRLGTSLLRHRHFDLWRLLDRLVLADVVKVQAETWRVQDRRDEPNAALRIVEAQLLAADINLQARTPLRLWRYSTGTRRKHNLLPGRVAIVYLGLTWVAVAGLRLLRARPREGRMLSDEISMLLLPLALELRRPVVW